MQLTPPTPRPADAPRGAGTDLGSLVGAALALPGVFLAAAPHAAHAATDEGEVALRMLHYEDGQPGLDRITVNAPSAHLLVPLGARWSIEGNAVLDNLSGATPRWHTAVSGASTMHESRHAYDVHVTHYRDRSSFGLGASRSSEHDYRSNALSFDASFSSDDNNTTFNLGLGASSDTIDPVNHLVVGERKRTRELLLGVTQAVTRADLAQLNLTFSHGTGYFDDPYKMLDQRPRLKNQGAVLVRWNHHDEDTGGTLRASYRWTRDTWGVSAHTLQAEWVQPVGDTVQVTPSMRLYTQSAARFYFDPVYDPALGEPYPVGYDVNNPPATLSADQRLSAFGGIEGGLKLRWQPDRLWGVELEGHRYEQRGAWRQFGHGSPGLAPFTATWWQVGVERRF